MYNKNLYLALLMAALITTSSNAISVKERAAQINAQTETKIIKKEEPKKLRILLIDGGGVRGIIPALVVAELEKQLGKPISEVFDIFGGTSAGGILSLGYTLPKSASEIVNMNDEFSKTVFAKQSKITKLKRVLTNGAQYKTKNLEAVLEENFHNLTISQTVKPVYITSFDLKSQSTVIFSTNRGKIQKEFDIKLKDVARATSAAPMYFEPFNYKYETKAGTVLDLSLIDGGIGNNNPVLSILMQIKKDYGELPPIEIVSIGTGIVNHDLDQQKGGLKLKKAVSGVIEGFFVAQNENSNDSIKLLIENLNTIHPKIKSTFTRFQVYLDKRFSTLDDISVKATEYLKLQSQCIIDSSKFRQVVLDLRQ